MTASEWRYALILVGAVALAVVVPWLRPKPIDWSDSFERSDTRPYGSRVLFESLPALFPNADTIRPVSTPYLHLRDTTTHRAAYLAVTSTLRMDPPETRVLLTSVARGNTAFLAAHHYDGPLADSLNLATTLQKNLGDLASPIEDSASRRRLHLKAANLARSGGYPVRADAARYAFSSVDTSRTAVLGTTGAGAPTLLRMQWGDGHLLLSTTPRVFTNVHALRAESRPYVWGALSYVPGDRATIWWDARHKPQATRSQNVMRFVLSEPALRMAYWLLLAGVVLFFATRARRRQRPVPVLEPPRNQTLDFVRRVGRLYYERGSHAALARKKINHFLAFVRRRLDLPEGPRTEHWIDRVARRAGVPRPEVVAVIETIETVQAQSSLDDDLLKTLDDNLDTFYERAQV